ncbi:hypothetical protein ACFSKS_13575 [Pseudocitrobacter faecalis]
MKLLWLWVKKCRKAQEGASVLGAEKEIVQQELMDAEKWTGYERWN